MRLSQTGRPTVPGVLLMAGRSSRLGFPKALLPLGRGCLIEWTLSRVLSSRLSPVILVLGDRRLPLRRVLAPFQGHPRLRVLYNPDFAQGMSTSIRKGLEAVDPAVPGVMFVLGDQPLIRTATIDRLLRVFCTGGAPAVVPLYAGQPGNPVIFRHDLLAALKRQQGDVGGRTLIKKHQTTVQFLPIRPAYQGWDVDTWEDYEKIKKQFNRFPDQDPLPVGSAPSRRRIGRP